MILQINATIAPFSFLEYAVGIIQQRLNLFTQTFSYIHTKMSLKDPWFIVLTWELNKGICSSQ